MKIRGFIVTVLAVALIFALRFVNTSTAAGTYSAHLITPTAGQVLHPGQNVKVQWTSVLPHIDITGCEMEVWLSLYRGRTFTMCITPILDPKAQFFYWTVPTYLRTQRSWIFGSGVKGGTPKATARSQPRLS